MASKLSEWSRAVKLRDGKCMDCGAINALHAHHILPKSTHPDRMLDVTNGKTLCYSCHKAEHEKKRPPRIRKEYRPHRKTLERKMESLEQTLRELTEVNRILASKVNVCMRGACEAALQQIQKRNHERKYNGKS